MPRLENWSVQEGSHLVGNIYDDEKGRFKDGVSVTTSRIFSLDVNAKIAETRNTVYKLGEMSKEYDEYLKSFLEVK